MFRHYIWIEICCIFILNFYARSSARDIQATRFSRSAHRGADSLESSPRLLSPEQSKSASNIPGAEKVKDTCKDNFASCKILSQELCNFETIASSCAKTCKVCKGKSHTTTPRTTTTAARSVRSTLSWNVWSECSRSCGTGTRYKVRPVLKNNRHSKFKIFQDCNNGPCPKANCQANEENRYLDNTSCCKIPNQNECGVPQPQPRLSYKKIVGGKRPPVNQWPWMVRVQASSKKLQLLCGGSIIDDSWIITAAHCVQSRNANDITIFIKYDQPEREELEVEEVVVHPGYDHQTNDVALLKLRKKLSFSASVKPICLPGREKVHPDTICYAAGWGMTENLTLPENLLQVGLRVLPPVVCQNSLTEETRRTVFCAGQLSGGKDTCLGDSGGPLMCQRKSSCSWFLAGITLSGSHPCGANNRPGDYLNVVEYEGWIRRVAFSI